MSTSESSWEAALDGAQIDDPAERERMRQALALAQELLQSFQGRIRSAAVAFRNYSAKERRLPLMIVAPFQDDEEYVELERTLAREVLGPVFKATRVSMPVTLTAPLPGSPVVAGPGVLFPTAA